MTFLEYVVQSYLGEPYSTKDTGESIWPCPLCERLKFHTRPHKPPHKDRFACWTCMNWGDVHDFLKIVRPDWQYADRKLRLEELQSDYTSTNSATVHLSGRIDTTPYFFSGDGSGGSRGTMTSTEAWYVEQVYDSLPDFQRRALTFAVQIAMRHNVDLQAMAYYCFHSEKAKSKV